MNLNLEKLKWYKDIDSIIQFGSSVFKKQFRDIDARIFPKRKFTLKEKFKLVRDLPEKYDICFYDDLPLNLRTFNSHICAVQ
ncbi:hypothetical protein J4479_05130 [Candidatus Woesearchaeota archaeon]|nr:hypothetical protein [uncultured archaeon]MBS3140361.1 hypothetical protein [Candidatus Woesearchaeota archaeon]